MQWTSRRATVLGMGAAAVLAVGFLSAPASNAQTSIDDACAELIGAGDNFAEACDAELASMDDSDAPLGVDEIASTPNLKQIANLPKQAPFDTASAYNTDIAFQGNYAFAGNYDGFTIYDIKKPSSPKILTQVYCAGSQNDISVYGNLLFLSTDSSRSDDSCESVSQSAALKESWEGMKIFDISNKKAPKYIKSVETYCGSHTHTLVPSKNGKTVYVYVSSYSPNANFPDCQPPHDSISIIEVPVKKPTSAKVISTPNLFPDGGYRNTSGCHDITAYPAKDLAAGACMGDGILLDISDRANPVVIDQVQDAENFAFWHSATFNNAGTKVVFTDELGGGGAATCNDTIGPKRGANAIYDVETKKINHPGKGKGADKGKGKGKGKEKTYELSFASYYKIPRTNANTENCVAHNGSLIPVKGKDIMVQAWYQGGISVWDFTDSANPVEIAYWERGPLSDERLILGGSWSAYWYNGYIYSSDIQKGLDVLKLTDKRTKSAERVKVKELNVQSQGSYQSW